MTLTLGEQIQARRKILGLTLKEVAAEVGVGESHMSLIENDLRDPSIRVLKDIARALKTTVTIALRITP